MALIKVLCRCGLRFWASTFRPEESCLICRMGLDPDFSRRLQERGFDPLRYKRECEEEPEEEPPESVRKEMEMEMPEEEEEPAIFEHCEFRVTEEAEIGGRICFALSIAESPLNQYELADALGLQLLTFKFTKRPWRIELERLIAEGEVIVTENNYHKIFYSLKK